jgi:hypothetical protein
MVKWSEKKSSSSRPPENLQSVSVVPVVQHGATGGTAITTFKVQLKNLSFSSTWSV